MDMSSSIVSKSTTSTKYLKRLEYDTDSEGNLVTIPSKLHRIQYTISNPYPAFGGTNAPTLAEIKNILEKHKTELKAKYGIKEIGIFGSYLRGEQKEKSDLDVLVEFEPDAKIDLIKFVELEEHLSDLLGINVDLVMKSGLKPRIGKHILGEVAYI